MATPDVVPSPPSPPSGESGDGRRGSFTGSPFTVDERMFRESAVPAYGEVRCRHVFDGVNSVFRYETRRPLCRMGITPEGHFCCQLFMNEEDDRETMEALLCLRHRRPHGVFEVTIKNYLNEMQTFAIRVGPDVITRDSDIIELNWLGTQQLRGLRVVSAGMAWSRGNRLPFSHWKTAHLERDLPVLMVTGRPRHAEMQDVIDTITDLQCPTGTILSMADDVFEDVVAGVTWDGVGHVNLCCRFDPARVDTRQHDIMKTILRLLWRVSPPAASRTQQLIMYSEQIATDPVVIDPPPLQGREDMGSTLLDTLLAGAVRQQAQPHMSMNFEFPVDLRSGALQTIVDDVVVRAAEIGITADNVRVGTSGSLTSRDARFACLLRNTNGARASFLYDPYGRTASLSLGPDPDERSADAPQFAFDV